MDWDALVNFIRATDPAFAASLKGASTEDVERVEADAGVRLPHDYRQFLMTFGRDSAGFYLFGPGYDQTLQTLADDVPSESYPGERYFKIAVPTDPSDISAPDYFLDLSRSDGEDAPVVMFEDVGNFSPANVGETNFSFDEHITRRIFTYLVLDRLRESGTVVIGLVPPDRSRATLEVVVDLLERMGFAPVLPSLPRVFCLRSDSVAAMVTEREGGFGIAASLASDESIPLRVALDQLSARFPDAILRAPDGRFGG